VHVENRRPFERLRLFCHGFITHSGRKTGNQLLPQNTCFQAGEHSLKVAISTGWALVENGNTAVGLAARLDADVLEALRTGVTTTVLSTVKGDGPLIVGRVLSCKLVMVLNDKTRISGDATMHYALSNTTSQSFEPLPRWSLLPRFTQKPLPSCDLLRFTWNPTLDEKSTQTHHMHPVLHRCNSKSQHH
jgi:hypothetical protein